MMKKIFSLIILIMTLSSCAVLTSTSMYFESEEEAFEWMITHITRIPDWDAYEGVLEYWQTPSETLSLLSGDCEDFAILWASWAIEHGWSSNPEIKCCYIPYYNAFHCYCTYDGKVFDGGAQVEIVLEKDYFQDKIVLWNLAYIDLIEE